MTTKLSTINTQFAFRLTALVWLVWGLRVVKNYIFSLFNVSTLCMINAESFVEP